jgi:hypothetical protein
MIGALQLMCKSAEGPVLYYGFASFPRSRGQTPVCPVSSLPNGYGTREKRDIIVAFFITKPNNPLRSCLFSDLLRPMYGVIIPSSP